MAASSMVRFVCFEEPAGYPERTFTSITTLKVHVQQKATLSFTLGYRLILAIYWTAWLLVRPFETHGWNGRSAVSFMEDLADWNAIVLCLFLWVAALGVVRNQSRPIDILACILHDITAPISLLITALYWIGHHKAGVSSAYSFHVHSVCGLLALVDLTLSRFPMYLKRFYPSALLLLAYLILTAAVWQRRHTAIDADLDYGESPLASGFKVFVLVFLLYPCIYMAAWRYELALFARAEAQRYFRARSHSAPEGAEMLGVADLSGRASATDEGRSMFGARSPKGEKGRREREEEEGGEEEEVVIELSHV